MESVSCIGKNETNNTFVDWSAFTSVDHRRYSFTFLNLTRLTYLTFTNFSSTFPRNDLTLSFTFINGLDEIGENTFQELNYYSDEPVDMTFTSPRNFKLVDYAFGRAEYFEIVIDSIQYSHINNLPYKFNLKSMDGIKFYQMSIINSGQVYFVSNGSSAIELTEITVVNCSLTNASLLIESFSTSIVDLDLSSNQLIEIPSMMKFQEMREIDLKNNLIEEITSNIFNNMINLNHLDLSNNRIRTIAADSFIGIGFLITLAIDNNFLTSLETITIDNRTTSFLHPLNKSLAFFSASNNFIRDLYPLKHMINLDNVTLCCNQIRTIEANTFGEASQLRTVDLSYNKIESIDSMAFNGTVINNLNLAGNPILSLETNFQEVQNQTTSFLYTVSATLFSLSISNCTNFIELNWFVISKLEILSNLELSQLNKTHKFWLYRKTDTNNEDSPINWNFPPHVILNGIRFTDNDYCLTKSIAHLLNRTTLIVDIDHPCNCFIFKFSDSFDKDQRPVCMSNESIVDSLSKRCADMDLYCELFSNGTTSSFIEWTSSSPMNSSTTIQFTSTRIVTTNVETTVKASSTTVPSSTSTTKVPSVSRTDMTGTQFSSEGSNINQQRKIIFATTIPIVVIITLCFIILYIIKRKQVNSLDENFEMREKILHTIDEE
ncbi:unnamed protein product [Rotaria sp. Silwood2]|nr:unnamed protein product [Rotaria sp. Silwood2]